jgi:hypothetical protein
VLKDVLRGGALAGWREQWAAATPPQDQEPRVFQASSCAASDLKVTTCWSLKHRLLSTYTVFSQNPRWMEPATSILGMLRSSPVLHLCH